MNEYNHAEELARLLLARLGWAYVPWETLAAEHRDAQAYRPADITAQWDDPVAVWAQFCAEVTIRHDGTLHPPIWQEELL